MITIIGHSPGPGRGSSKVKATKDIVKDWMNECGVTTYNWNNLVDFHAKNLKFKDITKTFENKEDEKIIALGNLVSTYLYRMGVKHLKVPHPSRKNRMWNDPDLEPKTINEIKKYIEN